MHDLRLRWPSNLVSSRHCCVRFVFFVCARSPKGYVMFRPISERHVTPKHNTVPMDSRRWQMTARAAVPAVQLRSAVSSKVYSFTSTTKPKPRHQHRVIRSCHSLKSQPVEPTACETNFCTDFPYMCLSEAVTWNKGYWTDQNQGVESNNRNQ
jgi:hypothetical protein